MTRARMATGLVVGTALLGAAAAGASGAARTRAPFPAPAVRAEAPGRAAPMLAMQALFDGYVARGEMPGIVGAFGSGDAPTSFVSAGRIASDPTAARAGPDSLWRVYSMTKPVTAMAAMILIEEGRLRLDEPLATYLPAFRSMRVLLHPDTSLAARPATRPITIRNLLTHTAGLGYNITSKGPLLREYERLGITPGQINAGVEARMRPARAATLQEFADRVASLPLIADPGTRWSYSVGLDVMGAVIERVSGMPFDRFVATRLLIPLRMNATYWTVPAREAGRLATSYTIVGNSPIPTDAGATSVYLRRPSFPYGGAGLVMSARDYDRFLHMIQDGGILDGVRVLRPETVALATSNLLPAGVTFGGVAGGTGGGGGGGVPMGYGAGGSVTLADGPGGFPARGTYGWGGLAGTIAWVDRARRTRATVMVNYFPADRWPVRAQVMQTLAREARR